MKNAKKLFSVFILGCVICTHAYNVYQTCYASELVVAGGLASGGAALLGLGAICGVGMELENNKRFNELSDEEKQRIENGLATDFNDVALQRGASLEHIKNWTTDLCNGVLDKASECWGIFKDWVKNINLQSNKAHNTKIVENGKVQRSSMVGMYNGVYLMQSLVDSWGPSRGANFWCVVISKNFDINNNSKPQAYLCYSHGNPINNSSSIVYRPMSISTTKIDGVEVKKFDFSSYDSSTTINSILDFGTIVKSYASVPCVINGEDMSNYDEPIYESLFSTNTDYLEKLKGQDQDVIDVIDVTDIKNPIVETRQNSLANINWNRGTRRTNKNNNDDDDNKIVTGLVPMDVWYEQIDDEQEQMQNAVVVYNNYIQEHPEEKDTYFISTTPVTNINNYFNTLPVVNLPTQGTVVNNYYEYNNYNNNNTTIYELPYNTELVPQIPTMVFENKFPFCIPFDIYQFFAMFYVEKEAPHIVVPVPFKGANGVFAEELTIDLSDYNYVSDVLRVMLYLLFIVGLMVATRRLIKG